MTPKIVSKRAFLHLDGSPWAITELFRSMDGGDFRVSTYLETSTSGATGSVNTVVQWGDDYRANTANGSSVANSGGYAQDTFVVHIPLTGTISVGTSDGADQPADANLFVVIEALAAPQFNDMFGLA